MSKDMMAKRKLGYNGGILGKIQVGHFQTVLGVLIIVNQCSPNFRVGSRKRQSKTKVQNGIMSI